MHACMHVCTHARTYTHKYIHTHKHTHLCLDNLYVAGSCLTTSHRVMSCLESIQPCRPGVTLGSARCCDQ